MLEQKCEHRSKLSIKTSAQYYSWETFFSKNHTQNVVEKLFPNPFLKNQNWAYL